MIEEKNSLDKQPEIAEMPDWAKFLMEHPVETAQQLRDFREMFPDAKGEVIMMKLLKIAGIPGY